MGEYSIGEAIQLLMQKSGWKPKVNELRIREEWEKIVGKTVAKYTRDLKLFNGTLTIYTDIAPLKQELTMGKQQLIQNINEHLGDTAITDIIIK